MTLETDVNGRTYVVHQNGQRTHYVRNSFTDPWKPSSTILIQHGFGRHSEFWYHWIPLLSRNFHVIRRDLRGHGFSSYPQEDTTYDYSIETILDEVIETLDALGVEKVHFLGESTGGILGEILAARYPERLLSLTVCSTPTHLPQAALDLFAFGRKDWPSACRELGSRGWAEALSRIPGTIPIDDPAYLPWYLDQISISSGQGLAGYAKFLSTLDARPYLQDIRVPTLILAPSQSAAVRVEDMMQLKETIPNARLEVVQGPGHEIYVTQAEKCQQAFLKFVAEI
ncbi:alpha/beta-hydrolase [Aaosphaeria arxii CBS 175.79]|uniref:Alpha/beta-hydrolase n=1 Tax=Aaosphaeria arxii CBS 175.79 TaxID=1450172 RepID=A0A6A5XFZ4_9PLEO|nr:alpha/beta-hydrolase [Aaosphaeria arxii CBS 175.79]KAF2011779.1 alpha/beta-hydrolase [Aaosphaeria arxii CBS 175.79]